MALILFIGRLCLSWACTPLGVGVVAQIYETDPSSAPGRKDLAQGENCPLMVYSSACFSQSLFLCLALSATLVALLLRAWGLRHSGPAHDFLRVTCVLCDPGPGLAPCWSSLPRVTCWCHRQDQTSLADSETECRKPGRAGPLQAALAHVQQGDSWVIWGLWAFLHGVFAVPRGVGACARCAGELEPGLACPGWGAARACYEVGGSAPPGAGA